MRTAAQGEGAMEVQQVDAAIIPPMPFDVEWPEEEGLLPDSSWM